MKTPVRIALIGSAGRMGRTIADCARTGSNIEIVAHCDQGDDIVAGIKKSDVVIDFSLADSIGDVCQAALSHRKPLVIGTTGHSDPQKAIIQDAAKSLAIVFASNFSVGVNALFALTAKAAQILGDDFNLEIIETHHAGKKDAPSGTAKTLAQVLKKVGKTEKQIPIQSIREGDVVGDHTVIFDGKGERLELVHRAKSRETFAKGALRAAEWIMGQPPGLYSMQDVLGLK
jgi:4-hydroxy-tetrahydrodipicolinate reductase